MTVKVLEETQVVRGTVVQCPDMYDNAQQTGYITGRSGDVFDVRAYRLFSRRYVGGETDSIGNYRGRWQTIYYPVSNKTKSISGCGRCTFDLNIYDRENVQNPSRYFIATDSELNSTIWRVDSAKPNGDDTQTLSLTGSIQTRFIRNTAAVITNLRAPSDPTWGFVRLYIGRQSTMAELPTPTQKRYRVMIFVTTFYAGGMLDKVVTSTDLTYTDRLGGEHYNRRRNQSRRG